MDLAETLTLTNEPFEVARAAAWLDERVSGSGFPPRVVAALQVALEEVLSNILCHGYTDLETHEIEVRLTTDPSAATLLVVDDGTPFDPAGHAADASEETPGTRPGGLGLLFVRRLMDEVTFERIDTRNHLTLRKFVSL